MLDDVRYAQAEGRKLGLRIDVTLCSGWPYGGNFTTLQQAAGRLLTVELPVPENATSVAAPPLAEGESFISASLVTAIARPVEAASGKARDRNDVNPPVNWDAASAQPLKISNHAVTVPPGDRPRIVLFFLAGHTGQMVKRAAVGTEGWVLDPFSHQAVATHLQKVGEPLVIDRCINNAMI